MEFEIFDVIEFNTDPFAVAANTIVTKDNFSRWTPGHEDLYILGFHCWIGVSSLGRFEGDVGLSFNPVRKGAGDVADPTIVTTNYIVNLSIHKHSIAPYPDNTTFWLPHPIKIRPARTIYAHGIIVNIDKGQAFQGHFCLRIILGRKLS